MKQYRKYKNTELFWCVNIEMSNRLSVKVLNRGSEELKNNIESAFRPKYKYNIKINII